MYKSNVYNISFIFYLISFNSGGQIIITVIIAVVIPLMITAAVMYIMERLSDGRGAVIAFGGNIVLSAEKSPLLKHYRADITLTNLFTGETDVIRGVRFTSQDRAVIRTLFVTAAENCSCGMLRAEVSAVKWRYGFCPVYVKGVPPKAVFRLIMPRAAGAAAAGFIPAEVLYHSATAADGVPNGAREYRRGDRLNNIHMKLSAKMGKYMVRESLPENDMLTFSFNYEREYAGKNAALLLGCAGECLSRGIKCLIFFGSEQAVIDSYEEIEPVFAQLLSAEREPPAAKAQFEITHGRVVCK